MWHEGEYIVDADNFVGVDFKVEKELTIDKRESAKIEIKVALEHLRNVWIECNNAFSNIFIDCNDYIIGSGENDNRYPFHLSFDEMNVVEWIDGALKRLSK